MTRIRPAAWLMAAVALFLLAVAGYALLVHASPQYYWTQIDTAVYRDSGIAVRNQPAMLYALGLGAAKLPFTYTPFAALLFAAGSGASFATWQVGLAVLTIGLLPVVAYLSLGLAGRPGGAISFLNRRRCAHLRFQRAPSPVERTLARPTVTDGRSPAVVHRRFQGRGTRQRGMRFRRTTRSRRNRPALPAWLRESPPTDGA